MHSIIAKKYALQTMNEIVGAAKGKVDVNKRCVCYDLFFLFFHSNKEKRAVKKNISSNFFVLSCCQPSREPYARPSPQLGPKNQPCRMKPR
jgi:hypothetical protein